MCLRFTCKIYTRIQSVIIGVWSYLSANNKPSETRFNAMKNDLGLNYFRMEQVMHVQTKKISS